MREGFIRLHRIDLSHLELPCLQIQVLDVCFKMEEIISIINELPSDRAPGTDAFNGLFFEISRDVIKHDIANVFSAFWSLDMAQSV